MAVQKVETSHGPRWRIRVYVTRDAQTGKRQIVTKTYARQKEAEAEERRLRGQKDIGVLTMPSREPLGVYVWRWLKEVGKGKVRERTYADYSGVVSRYIDNPPEGVTRVGNVRLDRLRPQHIQMLYGELSEDRGLSPRTIRSLHAVISQALGYATRTGAVGRNVAELVELPRLNRREVRAMSKQEAVAFLQAARGDRYHALWCVLLACGLRPGEALGLQWSDVDFDACKLHVQRSLVRRGVEGWKLTEPKTGRARRGVHLPAFVVTALRTHKGVQAKERLKAGAEYQTHGFVFATEFGAPLSASNVFRRNFRRVMTASGLGAWEERDVRGKQKRRFRPAYRMYDLRHTAATLQFALGIHPKAVSECLGHSSVAFTMDVYSASLPDLQEEAAAKLDAMLG